MGAFDFDGIIDRYNTASLKWDGMGKVTDVLSKDALALWVADMDFMPPPAVAQVLEQFSQNMVPGYYYDSIGCHKAIANWQAEQHGWQVDPDWIVATHGCVAALSTLIAAFCDIGDKVIIQTPVYHKFRDIVLSNDCQLADAPLILDGKRYVMDFDALARHKDAKAMILCSPHNPGGRVWTRSELMQLLTFCLSNDILLISDEIHADLTLGHAQHTPCATLSCEAEEKIVTVTAASKTFNLAGGMFGVMITKNPQLRAKIKKQLFKTGTYMVNLFGPLMTTAAYSEGAPWLEALRGYLRGNFALIEEFSARIPGLWSMPLDATYLAWLNFRETNLSPSEVQRRLSQEAHLALSKGEDFGADGGANFMRLNFATPRARLQEALERLEKAFS